MENKKNNQDSNITEDNFLSQSVATQKEEVAYEKADSFSVKKDNPVSFSITKKMILSFAVGMLILGAFFGAFFGMLVNDSKYAQFFRNINPNKDSSSQEKIALDRKNIISEDSAITNIAEKYSPAVVSIVVSKNISRIQNIDPFGFGFPFGSGSGNASGKSSQDTQKQEIGGGTGFFISNDGTIVTNKHVVGDSSADYTVVTTEGKEYPAKVLAQDPSQDIAIIKIEGNNFPVLDLGESTALKIGQTVVAIGNSLGEFSNTVSRGIISGLKRNLTAGSDYSGQSERLTNIIQTDAAINPGNSGGPLIDINGKVIGVNVAMAQGAQNVGFALPIDLVKKDIEQIKKSGKITAPFLGVRYLPVDATLQKDNNLPFDYGVLVQRGQKLTDLAVIPGSPADKANISENDIILEINGEKINDKNQLPDLIGKYSIGDTITVKIWHKGETKDIKVTLKEKI